MVERKKDGDNLPAKVGRPQAEIDYDQVEMCASGWMTHQGASTFLKISLSTFKNRMKDDPEFKGAWERGIGAAQNTLRGYQWSIAKQRGDRKIGAAATMAIHMSKHLLGETDKSTVEHANKGGKPLEVAVGRPEEFMGVNIADASDEELEAMAVIAAGRERRAAEAARDITGDVTEGP